MPRSVRCGLYDMIVCIYEEMIGMTLHVNDLASRVGGCGCVIDYEPEAAAFIGRLTDYFIGIEKLWEVPRHAH